MHIAQAIKMACKSLWTNKLRSFLTMLGIIIGVTTVSLLTTVAQGVSDAVVSSIRTQSTLAIFMNTSSMTSGITGSDSKTITYSELDSVLNQVKLKDKNDPKDFEYSMVYTSNGVVAMGDLSSPDDVDENGEPIDGAFINLGDSYNMNEVLQNITKLMKGGSLSDAKRMELIAEISKLTKQRPRPMSSTIYAVNKNFQDVYELEILGEYPKDPKEVLVDHEFVKAYFGEVENDIDVIGEQISFGINYYTAITFEFNSDVNDETRKEYVDDLLANLKCMKFNAQGLDGGSPVVYENVGLQLISDSSYTKHDENATSMTVCVKFFQEFSEENIKSSIVNPNPLTNPELKIYSALKADENGDKKAAINIGDVYKKNNTKAYTISGVISEENSASMFTGTTNTSSDDNSMINIMMTDNKGTCYMLLEEENLAPLGVECSLGELPITYAYLRYKSEEVMGESTTNIIITLMLSGHTYLTDFMLFSMSSVSNIIGDVMDILTTMLTVIAVISLLVGGIGIMNIMLVAVTERTREIGVRKAIGAKRSAILTQFLVEALSLSILGGAIGLIISAIGTAIIAHVIGFAMSMPLWVVGMSLGFCTAIGLIFGMFPAVKASKMQPIDALRRE